MKRLFKVGSDRHNFGKVTFAWHPEGNFLASAGRNGIIHITDRHGDIVDEIPMSNEDPILAMEWDRDGEYLAAIQQPPRGGKQDKDKTDVVLLWNLSSKRLVPLETNFKEPSFLAWSQSGPQLAVGTAKGELMIYNKTRKQKIPIVGKHSKRITCGSWSKGGNKLVLGGEDKTLTVSNENGDTLIQTDLKHSPLETFFTTSGEGYREENVVSANLNGKSLLLYNILDDKDDPMELTFAPKENGSGCRYGDLLHHHWYQENLVLIGFSGGYLLSVSTSARELGEEKFCIRLHSDNMVTFAYNPHLSIVASAGNDGVRIINVRDFKESKKDFIPIADLEDGKVTSVAWSPDGQILTVSTSDGNVYNFLAKMNAICATYKSNIAYLSSLREVSIVDAIKRGKPTDVMVKLEPSIIALGAYHVAAGMNNRVYFHRIDEDSNAQPVNDQEYVGIVKEIQLNKEFAVVLTDTKAMLHPIEPNPQTQSKTQTFPNREEGNYSKLTCIALTDNFLFYGTEAGTVEVFFLAEWTLLSGIELRLTNPIKRIYPNTQGTKVVVVDKANQVFLYNPVSGGGANAVTQFEGAPTNIVNVIWDLEEKNVVMLFDGNNIHTFIYIQSSMKGPLLVKLGPVTVSSIGEISLKPDKVDIPSGNIPLVSASGELTCQTSAGGISAVVHPFFDQLESARQGRNNRSSRNNRDVGEANEVEKLSNNFCQALALHKLEKAWEVAVQLDKRSFFLALSFKAMELLNVEMAYRVYNQLGDAGMVMALRDCMHIEDKNLLAGQIALLFCDYQRAQDLFLASSRPIAALEMRKDLMQWEQALKLAHVLAPVQIPDICIHYGQQLEVRDDIDNALKMFDDALHAMDNDGNRVITDDLVPLAMMGIARCNLRLGNIRQGIRMANELDDRQLFIDCGTILEQQKQYQDAASMFVKGLQYEKAALIYTKYLIKNDPARISEAAVILEKVENDALNSAFGKACVVAKRYDDALKAFKRANDWDKVVELQLEHLDQIQQAFDLVRKTNSAQAASIVAKYCQDNKDYRGAIEFLLIANKSEEAFKIAQSNNLVEVYTTFLGENISSEDALKVALFYEKNQEFGLSGRFYAVCGQYSRALRLFLQCGDKEIDKAIEVVGKSQNESLTHQLIDFLVGEKDGVPKDPNYIYRLYLALKKYDDAAKTALIIARQEQDLGNYSGAHSVIVETIQQLENNNIKINLSLRQCFILLHSYSLVKILLKLVKKEKELLGNNNNDNNNATESKYVMYIARLLLRVSQNISKFPMHIVPILTSTVIKCKEANLMKSAYDTAVTLIRPEYRTQIDAKFKSIVEGIVRKSRNNVDIPDENTPDPISNEPLGSFLLESAATRDSIPMCIITGKHMEVDDWCFCPISKFPALYSEYVKYIKLQIGNIPSGGPQTDDNALVEKNDLMHSLTAPDPIFGKSVSINDLTKVSKEDVIKYIQRYNNVVEKKENDEEKEGELDGENKAAEGNNEEAASPKDKKKNKNKAKLDRINRSKKRRANPGSENK